MAVLFDSGIYSVVSSTGAPLPGALLYWYATGTTTPLATYSDEALSTPNTNPVVADANGRFPAIWLQSAEYKMILKTSDGVTVRTRDPIDGTNPLDALVPAAGAGKVGFSQSATYAAGTLGKHDQNFVCVTDAPYNAVADGAWSGTVASGTDNYAAFVAADAHCAATGKRLYIPAGTYYCAQGLAKSAGVEWVGEGYVGLGTFIDQSTRKGTILLVNTGNGADSIKWAENSHGGSIASLSVFDVHTTGTPRAVINITGVLHPHMENVEFGSLKLADCPGLLLDNSTTGLLSETLYGSFTNLYCTQSNTVATAAVAIGVKIVGRSSAPNSRANDNHFFGGTLAGYRRALEVSALVAGAGVIGCSFHGTTFEGTYTVSGSTPYMTIDYVTDGAMVLGNNVSTPVYSVRLVSITDARQISFHGCYFELGGAPATYNDGTHGVLTLFPVVWLDNTTYVKAISFFGSSWNNAYVYDNGVFTQVDLTTDFHRYSAAAATFLKVDSATAQSIPTGVYTKVAFNFLQGDTYLTWDATNNQAQIHSAGVYDCHALVSFAGWNTATQSGVCEIVGGGHTEVGAYSPATGAVVSCECTSRLYLFPGDTIQVNAKQDSGSNKALSGDAKENRFSIVKIA